MMSINEKMSELNGKMKKGSLVEFRNSYIVINNVDDDFYAEFYIEKGNHKLPPTWYIGNTGSGTDCCSDELELCPYGLKNGDGSCYCLKAERCYPNCLDCRERNRVNWERIVVNDYVVEFTYGLLLASKQAKKHKMEVFRFNESFDIESYESLVAMNDVGGDLKDVGVKTMIYTHRWDMIDALQLVGNNLIMNGSDFMLDNEFRVVYEFSGNNLKCCGDCGICQKAYRGGWCTKKLSDMDINEFVWLSDYLHKKGYDMSMLNDGLVIEVLKH